MPGSITVDSRFCGIADRGQGGYLAGLVAEPGVDPVQVDFRNPIPLDVPLQVSTRDDRTIVSGGDKVIVESRAGVPPSRTPAFVPPDSATTARTLAETQIPNYVGSCFSCGTRPDTLRVHAGPVGDGRFATPYEPPEWVADSEGIVAAPFVWAPLDCASGWALAWHPPQPVAVTATYTVQVHEPVHADSQYIVVADTEAEWRGRRRLAWSAMYTTSGRLVAHTESLWIRLREH
jgi:hypothetical protein